MVKLREEDMVVYSVKRCGKVKQDENGGRAGISCHQQVIGDPDQSCLSTVRCAESRLELLSQTVEEKVVLELSSSDFFQHFG